MAYSVEGQLLEVCTCNILCPCWVGGDPNEGYCEAIVGWHIKEGEIEGVRCKWTHICYACSYSLKRFRW